MPYESKKLLKRSHEEGLGETRGAENRVEGLAMKLLKPLLMLLELATTPCQLLKFCGSSAAGEKNPAGIGGMVAGAGESIPGN